VNLFTLDSELQNKTNVLHLLSSPYMPN
jgi:hypothetical protein